jgi:hypothetical protein
MPISLRPLLYNVQGYRPDLVEMMVMDAIQETASDVLRRSYAWDALASGTLSTSSNTQTLSVSPVSLTLDDGSVTPTIAVKPIRIKRFELSLDNGTSYLSLSIQPNIFDDKRTSEVTVTGVPGLCYDQHGKAVLNAIPAATYTYRAKVAVTPTDWFEFIDLPSEYKTMITSGAIAKVLASPGEAMDLNKAQAFEADFRARFREFLSDHMALDGMVRLPAFLPGAHTPKYARR